MIKATSGGGGKGMRIVREESELEDAFHRAKSEAEKSFGNSEVYIERYIDNPKHIEVQVIGDDMEISYTYLNVIVQYNVVIKKL
ncbi:pyruvate carboxylase [Staphylococcus aureus]|nr:pyruvate carboxylase [Staphylococcus aureus]